ncbi:MAG: T9SS type A sorting domain-containing protein, partial [Bacteroidales bacterium]|nr:T9SS type A sorting domain-containing protein [Bacteroidales bacterium]
ARFRVNSNGGLSYDGYGYEGEVEDYRIEITQSDNLDLGDAPDNGGTFNYHTLIANNGARHKIDPDVFLGDLIDAETDGQPTINALGDDNNNLDDEDGVRMRRFMAVGGMAKVSVKASVDGFLNAWIDFNRDGDWSGPGEQIFTDEPLVAGWNTFTFMVPTTAEKGRTYARFRYNTTGGLTFEGPADDGEVEDYVVAIFPENWGFEITDLSHLIVVPVDVNQVLKGSDSYSLMPGDFLGVFYDDDGEMKCGGAINWQGDDNQVLMAYGDDPTTPEKEGFDEGEMMNFKVSMAANGEVFDAQVSFNPEQPNSNGEFHNNGLSALTGIALVGASQILDIAEGWSGISTFIEPLNANVVNMFAPVENDLVVLYKLNGSMYWPGQNLNTIGQWNVYDGHVIKMSQDAAIEVNGSELVDKTVQLQEGLNLIPVLSTLPFDVEMLFSSAPGVALVKEVAGIGVYLPEWSINTIGAVLPGSAYFVMTNEAGIISFDLGSNKSGAVYEPASVVSSPWNSIENTPGSHVVVFNLAENPFVQGDVVGGFAEGNYCAGLVQATKDGRPFALTLNANDPYNDAVTGFEKDEKLQFKLYRASTGEYFDLVATFSNNYTPGYYQPNALSEISNLKLIATGTEEAMTDKITVYPNPSTGIFRIDGAHSNAEVEVVDAYGKLIMKYNPELLQSIDLSGYPTGLYFLKVKSNAGKFSIHKLMLE